MTMKTTGVKYLRVKIDPAETFRGHLMEASVKATKASAAVKRLMPNMGDSSQAKRKLLQMVATSRLMYAAPVWAKRLDLPVQQEVPDKSAKVERHKGYQRI